MRRAGRDRRAGSTRAAASRRQSWAVLFFCLVGVSPSWAGLANAPWPMAHHDLRHTGRSPYNGPSTNHVKWIFPVFQSLESSPTVGPDGTVYFGASLGRLCAVNPDGTEKWCNEDPAKIRRSTPAIAADGSVYIGARDNRLWAIDGTGDSEWSYVVGDDGDVSTSSAIAPDGTVYMSGTFSGRLHALNPNGTLKWRFQIGLSVVNSSPALAADGTLYIGSARGILHAFTPGGTRLWMAELDKHTTRNSSPVIGDDGTIYIGGSKGISAVNPNGTIKWEFPTAGKMATPAIATDGTIYAGEQRGGSFTSHFYALDPDGNMVWEYVGEKSFRAAPALGADGTIYTCNGSHVIALNPNGTVLWDYETLRRSTIVSTPAIGGDGTLYVTAEDLYAFGPDTP